MTVGGRDALVRAAAECFARDGIDRPSMREISRLAQQGNTSAIQYHFGDRDQLLQTVLDRHQFGVDLQRSAMLDGYEFAGDQNARTLAAALVLPEVAKLSDDDGGAEYLQIIGEVVARPARFAQQIKSLGRLPSMQRWSALVEPVLPSEAVGKPLHRRFAVIRFVHGELASRSRERRRNDQRLFANHLIDLVEAMLTARVASETAALIHRSSADQP